jgi:hypothetical protein
MKPSIDAEHEHVHEHVDVYVHDQLDPNSTWSASVPA